MYIVFDSEIPILKVLPTDDMLSVVQKGINTEIIITALFVVAKD